MIVWTGARRRDGRRHPPQTIEPCGASGGVTARTSSGPSAGHADRTGKTARGQGPRDGRGRARAGPARLDAGPRTTERRHPVSVHRRRPALPGDARAGSRSPPVPPPLARRCHAPEPAQRQHRAGPDQGAAPDAPGTSLWAISDADTIRPSASSARCHSFMRRCSATLRSDSIGWATRAWKSSCERPATRTARTWTPRTFFDPNRNGCPADSN